MYRIITLMLCLFILQSSFAAGSFPGRSKYPEVKYIGLEELHQQKEDVIIIDVRSAFEYDTLHIAGAIHNPISNKSFIPKVKEIRAQSDKKLVFYCNGHTCMKSYKAVMKTIRAQIDDCYAFDAGIFDWSKAYPDEALLLGETLKNPKKLLSTKDLNAHMLTIEEFNNKALEDNSTILDVRDKRQRKGLGIFIFNEKHIEMDNTVKMRRYLARINKKNKTLLIYDATGKQVRWLQYLLEKHNVKNYYFMKGGADIYYENLIHAKIDESTEDRMRFSARE